MKVTAVFSADTHISEATWSSRAPIRGDSFFGFQQVVELAIKHQCPLILAGDCWELMHQPRPSSATVEFVRSQINALEYHKLPLYFVNGQHDQLASPYWFNAIHGWPQHIGQRGVMIGGQPWFGLDYFEVSQAQQQLGMIPQNTYGAILHQQWQQFTDSKFISPMTLDDVPYVRVAISGDMHQTITDDKGTRLYISPGATHMRSLSEPQNHYAVVMTDAMKFDTVKLRSRPVLTWQIYRAADMYEQMESIRSQVVEARQRSLDSGVPVEVARPLLIIEDHAVCDALQVVEQAISEAHVVARRVTVKQDANKVEAAEVLDTTLDVRQLFMQLAIERDPVDARRIEVIRSLVYGEDPVAAAIKVSS